MVDIKGTVVGMENRTDYQEVYPAMTQKAPSGIAHRVSWYCHPRAPVHAMSIVEVV